MKSPIHLFNRYGTELVTKRQILVNEDDLAKLQEFTDQFGMEG